ncbi:histidine kinase [Nocardioides sp. MAH-18]|uniref:Histidine kinase n=1 Tax=Nocardioides agri TaxID=2682843 RepID=A0A6L6XX65_9ACTN|nr:MULTISPECIES: histidine kinase [unclassified Nocardioides]MBA2952207.1 histidine kinase [Nocardioides sp. CGMCC 1.13656]MVQ51372.1 histidine kinase [Nocardioides sp. MAH-18]
MSEQRTPPNQVGRLGPLFAGIWLFFLLDPLLEGWAHRDEPQGVVGIVATLAFAAVYMALWVRLREDRHRLVECPPMRFTVPYLLALVLLAGVMVATLGETGLASVVYIAVAAVMVFPFRVAAVVVVLLVLGSLALSAVEDWGSQIGLAFGIFAASVAIFGMRAVMRRNIQLIRAEQENASLAVENERTRFARDLHDILGHSLTVITVKAELAQRLLDRGTDEDVDRARTELADLERLSRDALADVRRAVEGYRELTLPGELARARSALAAAEIDAELPNSADEVPTELRELFAWTVREGVTNVLRHSGARRCQVVLSPTAAEVRDDGAGPTVPGTGSGLAGLRERAAATGATVVTQQLDPGFVLRVVRA